MEKTMVHPIVVEHVQILELYFKKQKELFNLMREEPKTEFEENTYTVKLMELNEEVNRLSEKLNETVIKLSSIPYREPHYEF